MEYFDNKITSYFVLRPKPGMEDMFFTELEKLVRAAYDKEIQAREAQAAQQAERKGRREELEALLAELPDRFMGGNVYQINPARPAIEARLAALDNGGEGKA